MSQTTLSPAGAPSALVVALLQDAASIPGFGVDVDATLAWVAEVGSRVPPIGAGTTAERWDLIAGAAHLDVAAARMLEPHLDALDILAQARPPIELDGIGADDGSTWGVFAAEAPGAALLAEPSGEGWVLRGRKAWCSLASRLTHALVTATLGDGRRRLFAVDLRGQLVVPHDGPWVARGLPGVVSAPVDFADAPAVPVGEPGWYLERAGFAWGGMTVAAAWWGSALGVLDALTAAAETERADQLALVHAGRADAALWAARAALSEASALIDQGRSAEVGEKLLAQRVRSIVADAAATTLAQADAALGPAPLVADESFASRVADLHLYLRQDHGARDLARIGRALASRNT